MGLLRTDIEVRKRVGRVCRFLGYEPRDALGRLTGKDVERGIVAS